MPQDRASRVPAPPMSWRNDQQLTIPPQDRGQGGTAEVVGHASRVLARPIFVARQSEELARETESGYAGEMAKRTARPYRNLGPQADATKAATGTTTGLGAGDDPRRYQA
jgi:hypothetical protein